MKLKENEDLFNAAVKAIDLEKVTLENFCSDFIHYCHLQMEQSRTFDVLKSYHDDIVRLLPAKKHVACLFETKFDNRKRNGCIF